MYIFSLSVHLPVHLLTCLPVYLSSLAVISLSVMVFSYLRQNFFLVFNAALIFEYFS